MSNLFLNIYDFFSIRKRLMYSIMLLSTVVMLLFALQVKFEENITNFFSDKDKKTALVFDNLKIKDRIVVMVSAKEKSSDPYTLIDIADAFTHTLMQNEGVDSLFQISARLDDSKIEAVTQFIFRHLPLFLTQADYARLDTLTTPAAMAQVMARNYQNLLSPMGGFIGDYIYRDPLGLSASAMQELQKISSNFNYEIVDGYLFSKDQSVLYMFISPKAKMKNAGESSKAVDYIEEAIAVVNAANQTVVVEYFGAPAVAVYNARQIKIDTMITLNIAILIVILFIAFAFKAKRNILLMLLPVLFGALFALFAIYFLKGEMSSIAVGAGSVVFGIALSYSIHIISHANHCTSSRQIIKDMSYPLTVGSFTTIGAFAGLLFTDSKLLQDFGLFSALTLVGTTLFSLVFLPHFIRIEVSTKNNKLLSGIENFVGKRWERSKWLVAILLTLTVVCSFFYQDVKFNSDMMTLNFEPPHLRRAEQKLDSIFNQKEGESKIVFIAANQQSEDAVEAYIQLCTRLDSLQATGDILSYSSISPFILSCEEQQIRLTRWRDFWDNDRRKNVEKALLASEQKYGFEAETFAPFIQQLSDEYSPINYRDTNAVAVFEDWINHSGDITQFIAHVKLNDKQKSQVYDQYVDNENIVIADRSFFAGKMAQSVNDNFYLILYISAFLIFFALLLSYGRIELTLIAFLPMFISWIIILGLMALFDIEFNIVNVILSTFIFGIGDDFSIFIMDGLLTEYRTKQKVMSAHKTAIFFSAFAIVVGTGALLFAQHPALKSLAIICLFGIVAVVLVSFTIQPIIFRLLISSQTDKKGFPYTLFVLLNSIVIFGVFMLGCIIIRLLIIILHLLPIHSKKRRLIVHRFTSWASHALLRGIAIIKMIHINDVRETFDNPAIVIANHQSFIDILVLCGLHPKMVMVTNSWVWKSYFFGSIIRYLGFYHAADGYEKLARNLRDKIADGYSVIIFPEGTRSKDGQIGRFHKGAFYLAHLLQLDIVPVLLYGNGLVSSKTQPFYIKKGLLVSKIYPRISPTNTIYGWEYQERAKKLNAWFRTEYEAICDEYNNSKNPYFYDALIKNYIYKGPVLEWYMRVKVKMEKQYDFFHRIIPREAHIVDLGCGYGPLPYMLMMLSHKRTLLGVDYDHEKIDVARNGYLENERIQFLAHDIRTVELPMADVFILNDVLHYIPLNDQRMVIENCMHHLRPQGKIIIRDGDSTKQKQHKVTQMTEKWSTRIMGFNQVDGQLHFTSSHHIRSIVDDNGMHVEAFDNDSVTSNTIFVITQKENSYVPQI